MARQDEIDQHNREVLQRIIGKQVSAVSKRISIEEELKEGTLEIRRAYFKKWYDSCKDIYNKERKRKRKEKKRKGESNG